jgi:hypothetical protein
MKDIISFKCVRIQSELERYERSKIIPHDLIEGTYSIDDIEECLCHFDAKNQYIAMKLIKAYKNNMAKHFEEIKIELRNEYSAVVANLETLSTDFQFPTVLHRYRPDINPVTALYYESRELVRSFDPDNDRHQWLLGLIQDREFNNQLVDALSKDIVRLDRIVSRYYWPMHKLSNDIPLELFHSRQITTDFKHYITMFRSILEWEPN